MGDREELGRTGGESAPTRPSLCSSESFLSLTGSRGTGLYALRSMGNFSLQKEKNQLRPVKGITKPETVFKKQRLTIPSLGPAVRARAH